MPSRRPWRPGDPIAFESERFVMRSLTPRDANETVAKWFADPEVMHALQLATRTMSVAAIAKYFQRFDNDRRLGIGIFPEIGAPAIGMYDIGVDRKNLSALLNVAIGQRDWWGKGVVVETREALLRFLFETAGLDKVWGGPPARNFPSLFNYKAQRFRQEGILRGQLRGIRGERVDQIIFGMLREEWFATRYPEGQAKQAS